MITTKDVAWLAGLLEGEGTFGMHRSGKYVGTPKIAVQMTDKDVVERAAFLFGRRCNGPYGPYHGNKLPAYQTMITGRRAVGWMMTLYSLMGERRRRKIEETLAIWREQKTIAPERRPVCHPDRAHDSKGLCTSCYMRQYHKERKHALVAP